MLNTEREGGRIARTDRGASSRCICKGTSCRVAACSIETIGTIGVVAELDILGIAFGALAHVVIDADSDLFGACVRGTFVLVGHGVGQFDFVAAESVAAAKGPSLVLALGCENREIIADFFIGKASTDGTGFVAGADFPGFFSFVCKSCTGTKSTSTSGAKLVALIGSDDIPLIGDGVNTVQRPSRTLGLTIKRGTFSARNISRCKFEAAPLRPVIANGIGGALTDWFGYHWAMGVAAALAGLGALVAFFVLPETKGEPSSPALLPTGEKGAFPLPPGERVRVRGISLPILTILALLAINRLIMAGMFCPTFGLYLREVVGETVLVRGRAVGITTLTGFGLGLSTFLGMWFGLGVGHWSDRAKNRWGVAAAGLIPGIIGFLTLALGPAWGAAVAVPLNSMTSGSNQGMATVLLGHEVGEGERGRWLGTLFTIGDLASAIGPLLTFALLESVALTGLYILAAILLTMMFTLACFTLYQTGQKTTA